MVWPGGGAGRCRLGNRSFRDFSNRLSAQRPTRDGGVAGTFLAQPAFEQRQVGEDERRACEPGTIGEEALDLVRAAAGRSEEHTSELQSLMRISYAVFCLKKKTNTT